MVSGNGPLRCVGRRMGLSWWLVTVEARFPYGTWRAERGSTILIDGRMTYVTRFMSTRYGGCQMDPTVYGKPAVTCGSSISPVVVAQLK